MSTAITVVDAFTDQPFAGNPAGVCILPRAAPEEWMRDVARELNLSETAFLHRVEDGYSLRWFTPTIEVDLCGHATLASAHVLWKQAYLPPQAVARFHTRSGLLTATTSGDRITLDFPAKIATASEAPPLLLPALGVAKAVWIGKNQFDYLVEVPTEAAVRALNPNHAQLATLPVRGVIVTGRAEIGQPYDFVSRFFAPGSGIAEDPVTGSAHCALAPYWRDKIGRDTMTGFQASPRGGTVYVEVRGDRVLLGGHAVTVLRGTLV